MTEARQGVPPAADAKVTSTIAALRSRTISVVHVGTASEARAAVLSAIKTPAQVISGGSQTVRDLCLPQALRARPGITYANDDVRAINDATERYDYRRAATASDYVIGSANALVMDGRIVNADGGGSRIASYAYAARNVIMIVSTNKVCASLDDAVERVRRVAARRIAERPAGDRHSPPCHPSGICREDICRPPARECGKVLIIEKESIPGRILVVLVDEPLGY